MKEKLVIVGAGHLAKEIVDFVQRYDLFDIVAFTVNEANIKTNEYLGKPIYPMERLEDYFGIDEVKLFCAVSWYNHFNKYKEELFNTLAMRGYHFANLIAPNAVIRTEFIGEGNWINEFVLIGFNAKIGSNNVFNPHSSVGHYTIIGDHNFISLSASINGHVVIGNRTYILGSSVILNRIKIGNKCVVGAGAIIKKDMKDCTVAFSPRCKTFQVDEDMVESFFLPYKNS